MKPPRSSSVNHRQAMRSFPPPLAAASLLLAIALLANGCANIPPSRRLPESIRGVYIPMVQNESYEPGVEEYLTRKLQEEFLVDGELQVRPRRQADVSLQIVLKKVLSDSGRFHRDRFALQTELTLIADAKLYSIDDLERTEPLFLWSNIEALSSYSSDSRHSASMLRVDGRRAALDRLAQAIVAHVITQSPDQKAIAIEVENKQER